MNATSSDRDVAGTSRLPTALGVIGVAAGVGAIVLAILERSRTGQPSLAEQIVTSVTSIGMVSIGGLLATRRRDSPLGWIIIAIGLETVASQLSYRFGLHYLLAPGASPPRPASTSTTEHLEDTLDTVLATMLFVLFPNGRPPTPRWRLLIYSSLTIGVVSIVARWLVPGPLGDLPGVTNPFGVSALATVAQGVRDASVPILNVLFLVAVASLVTRWRRAIGIERQQIKVVAGAASVLVVFLVLGNLADAGALGAGLAPLGHGFFFAVLVLPTAVTVAVLRYRLHDIDFVISRALVFAALAAFVSAVYVTIVVGFGQLLSVNGSRNVVLSIAATAVTAIAFQPARERAQRLANRLVYGERATPYEVLSSLAARLGDQVTPDEQLRRVAELLASGTGGNATVWLRVGRELRPVATWPATAPLAATALDEDASPDFGHVDRAVPVSYHDETLGFLTLSKPAAEPMSPTDDKLMGDLAGQTGLLLRNARLSAELLERLEQLRASRQRLVAAQDEERRRLERDLHDGAQQQLVALRIKLNLAKTIAAEEHAPETGDMIGTLVGDADDAVQTLRALAHGIYPPLLAAEGLATALRSHAAKAVNDVSVTVGELARYDQNVEAAVYFCCLEALQNITKYAPDADVVLALDAADDHLLFSVADNGAGFDPAATRRGAGLQNMEDRLDAIHGTLTVESQVGAGTTIRGRILVVGFGTNDGAG
ncbi:MAG: hypothetical protein H0U92_04635 [Actinobacteria bacterium]|nr:hypothetical protein [Actinomycetota bacterium]